MSFLLQHGALVIRTLKALISASFEFKLVPLQFVCNIPHVNFRKHRVLYRDQIQIQIQIQQLFITKNSLDLSIESCAQKRGSKLTLHL